MIKYGMPTLIEYQTIEENVLLCQELQLDFIELNMSMPYCLEEINNITHLKKLKESYKINFTMHFPEELDFGSIYPEIQQANLALFKRYLDYCTKVGISKINIHLYPGTKVTLPNKTVWVYETEFNNYLLRLQKALNNLVKMAYPYRIQVCVENSVAPLFYRNIFMKLKQIPNLLFTYDVGHDAITNYMMEAVYQSMNEKVVHMHLHDYDKVTDHQILFKGIINLYEKLDFAKRNNMTVVIEVKTVEALRRSVYNLKMRHLI